MGIFKKGEKKTEDKEDDFYYVPLTNQQLQELNIEVIQCGGENKFLEHIGVVKLNKFKSIQTLIDNPSLHGKKVRENWEIHYKDSVLYSTWSKIFQQLNKYRFGIEQQKYRDNPDLKQRILDGVRLRLKDEIGFRVNEEENL